MNEITFRITLFLFIILFILIKVPAQVIFMKNKKVKEEDNLFQSFSTLNVILANVIFPFVYIFSTLLDWAYLEIPVYLRFTGVGIYILVLVLVWSSERTLGRNWSPLLQIRKEHTLVMTGPYKYIRHPIYASLYLLSIAQFLISSNWFLGVISIFAVEVFYRFRVEKEELQLIEHFGKKYKDYMKTTGRLFFKFNK